MEDRSSHVDEAMGPLGSDGQESDTSYRLRSGPSRRGRRGRRNSDKGIDLPRNSDNGIEQLEEKMESILARLGKVEVDCKVLTDFRTEQNSQLRTEMTKLNSESKNLQDEINSLKVSLERAEVRMDRAKDTEAQLVGELSSLKSELRKMDDCLITDTESIRSQLCKSAEFWEERLEQLDNKLRVMSSERSEDKTMVHNLTEQVCMLSEQFQNSQSTFNHLVSLAEESKKDYQKLLEKLETVNSIRGFRTVDEESDFEDMSRYDSNNSGMRQHYGEGVRKDNSYKARRDCRPDLRRQFRPNFPREQSVREPSIPKLDHFDGQSSSWPGFINNFETRAELLRWDVAMKLIQFQLYLKGAALNYFLQLPEEVRMDYDEVIISMKEHFMEEMPEEAKRVAFQNMQQKEKETISKFAERVRDASVGAFVGWTERQMNEERVSVFLRGLSAVEASLYVMNLRRPGDTLHQAVTLVNKFICNQEAITGRKFKIRQMKKKGESDDRDDRDRDRRRKDRDRRRQELTSDSDSQEDRYFVRRTSVPKWKVQAEVRKEQPAKEQYQEQSLKDLFKSHEDKMAEMVKALNDVASSIKIQHQGKFSNNRPSEERRNSSPNGRSEDRRNSSPNRSEYRSEERRNFSPRRNKDRDRCHGCGERGHWQRDCTNRSENETDSSSTQSSRAVSPVNKKVSFDLNAKGGGQ